MQIKTLTPTVSSVTDFTSAGVDLGDITTYSFYTVFSGSNVAGTNYVDLSSATASITSSGDALINATDAGYRYVRYDWNYSSGTGNLTVVFCSKEQLSKTRNRSGK